MTQQKKYTDLITEFLVSHPAISIQILEKELGLPSTTIAQAKQGRNIPAKHIYPIICHLVGYGLKIDGFTLSYDPSDKTISGRKWLRNVRSREAKHGYFIYTVEEEMVLFTAYDDLV